MPPAVTSLVKRFGLTRAIGASWRDASWIFFTASLHLTALSLLWLTENGFVAKLVFLLTWGVLNFFWLGVLRRPAAAALLSLSMVVLLILVSEFKFNVIWMTASFFDFLIVDSGTVGFLLSVTPGLYRDCMIITLILLAAVALAWRFDPFQVRRRTALVGFAACLGGIVVASLAQPQEEWEAFFGNSFVSKFVRSGVGAVSALVTQGVLDSDAVASNTSGFAPVAACNPAGRPPHILMVHDESSFDIRAVPGIKVPDGYGAYFRSFDGKARQFVVEGAGGPSWYTDYNVIAGLSARSFGRFSYYVTEIAAGRVLRGLPASLTRCGYRTATVFPALGAFMGSRNFQTSEGIQSFYDAQDLGTNRVEPDKFYYDAARRIIERDGRAAPLFVWVYLGQNHFPWDYRLHPEQLPDWKDPGNSPPLVDEYLRRQALSARDYAELLEHLKRDFPDESFLLVRYGDHQPDFASFLLDRTLGDDGIRQHLMSHDPRYFTTYYAIDAVNFQPVDTSSALDTIEGPYLPLVIQEAAGLPVDLSFAEQKKILERCNGRFYDCDGGAEARRFNRLLIDAGLIKGL